MSETSGPPNLPAETYVKVIRELLAWWVEITEIETKEIPVAYFVFAHTASAFAQGRAAVALWDAEMRPHSAPLVRGCLESAIYSAWSQQNDIAAVDATAFEAERNNLNLLSSAKSAGVQIPAEVQKLMDDQSVRIEKNSLAGQVRNFKQVCDSLTGGDALYLYYRHLSGLSHATGSLSRHLNQVPNSDPQLIKNPIDKGGFGTTFGFVTAASLIWAGSAFAQMSPDSHQISQSSQAAITIGVPPILVSK